MASTREPARIAVVGAGTIGMRHLQAIATAVHASVAAIVDPAPAGAPAATKLSVPQYDDIEPMLSDVRPQGVIIATPNSLHVPMALACVHAGIPVLVEKPIADTLDAAWALADASEANGVAVLVGHHRRYNPIVRTAREITTSGALGQLTAVSATWLAHKPDAYFDTAWRRQPGGGPILINLIHDIDNLRFIVGDIASVQSMTSNTRRGYAVEDTAALLLRFRNGALGTVILSDNVSAPWSWELTAGERTSYRFPRTGQDCYLLAGTDASLAVPSMRLWRHEGAPNWQTPLPMESLQVDEDDPIQLQIAHFADVIHGLADPVITARDAEKTLEATLAVVESADSQREVVLTA